MIYVSWWRGVVWRRHEQARARRVWRHWDDGEIMQDEGSRDDGSSQCYDGDDDDENERHQFRHVITRGDKNGDWLQQYKHTEHITDWRSGEHLKNKEETTNGTADGWENVPNFAVGVFVGDVTQWPNRHNFLPPFLSSSASSYNNVHRKRVLRLIVTVCGFYGSILKEKCPCYPTTMHEKTYHVWTLRTRKTTTNTTNFKNPKCTCSFFWNCTSLAPEASATVMWKPRIYFSSRNSKRNIRDKCSNSLTAHFGLQRSVWC